MGDMIIRQVDGAPLVERADDEILIAAELVTGEIEMDPAWWSVEGNVLTVRATNGVWRYRLDHLDEVRQHYTARRLVA